MKTLTIVLVLFLGGCSGLQGMGQGLMMGGQAMQGNYQQQEHWYSPAPGTVTETYSGRTYHEVAPGHWVGQ